MNNTTYWLNYRFGESPFLFWLHTRFKPAKKLRYASKEFDIVIDGYPRSANSYAYACFCVSQKKACKVGHHIHVPAQIIRGSRLHLPTILLIRDPEKAIPSLQLFYPDISMANAIRGYISFYSTILEGNYKFVLAEFNEVISDFGEIIKRVNQLYGTYFTPYIKNEFNESRVRDFMNDMIEEYSLSMNQVLYPTKKKKELRNELFPLFYSKKLEPLREEAILIYKQLVSRNLESS